LYSTLLLLVDDLGGGIFLPRRVDEAQSENDKSKLL